MFGSARLGFGSELVPCPTHTLLNAGPPLIDYSARWQPAVTAPSRAEENPSTTTPSSAPSQTRSDKQTPCPGTATRPAAVTAPAPRGELTNKQSRSRTNTSPTEAPRRHRLSEAVVARHRGSLRRRAVRSLTAASGGKSFSSGSSRRDLRRAREPGHA